VTASTGEPDELPYVDEHTVIVELPPDEAFARLDHYVGRVWARPDRRWVEHLLGTEHPGGFAVESSQPPERMVLAGRHRFARYRLEFHLTEVPAGTRLTARTHARFPGPHGFAYETLVIRSRLHVVATRRILRAIASERG
jgi:hypothetical protein